jgi:hypothetical protein
VCIPCASAISATADVSSTLLGDFHVEKAPVNQSRFGAFHAGFDWMLSPPTRVLEMTLAVDERDANVLRLFEVLVGSRS